MNRIEPKLDFEPKDNYKKAKKLLLETDKAIQALTPQEQQKNSLVNLHNIKEYSYNAESVVKI